MGTSITLFRIFDIDVRVHWSFVLILAYGAFIYGNSELGAVAGALFGVLTILLLFACVTLHEFGHALVAKYFKVNVPHITLLPIGGVASLERMPDKPMQEFLIAIAGPLVNFVIALLLWPVSSFSVGSFQQIGTLMAQALEPSLLGLIKYLVLTNLLLGIFNLLPAFPMDGGRILRALLAMVMPYVQATNIAVLVGRMMAVLFFLWGIFSGNIFLMLIAFFVYVGGGSERSVVESRYVLRNIKAVDALTPGATSLYTSEKLQRAVDLLMSSYQTDYPVLDLSNKFVGVLSRGQLINTLKTSGSDARIVDAMLPAASVPVVAPGDNLADVWEKMATGGGRAVAVKQGGNFMGLITVDDITEVFHVVGASMTGEPEQEQEPAPRIVGETGDAPGHDSTTHPRGGGSDG